MLISAYFRQKTHYPYFFTQNYPPMPLSLPPPSKGFCCLYMSKKNNPNYNNLDCQTSTSRLYNLNYNLDYIIYKLKQTGPKYPLTEKLKCSTAGEGGVMDSVSDTDDYGRMSPEKHGIS
jgi:hypothetical protein